MDAEIPEEFLHIFARFNELEAREIRKVQDEPSAPSASSGGEKGAADVQTGIAFTQAAVAALENKPVKKNAFKTLSKKQLKQLLRPSVASLKLNAPRPDVVESWDVTSPDPRTLVWLKALRNSVPVPVHWSLKSRYLSGKRAYEKVAYRLPPYMEATRIGEIRAALLEKEARKSLKQKQRAKVRPKAHRLHIDFQLLHDAFFKYAEKPELCEYGEVYFEGKERIARAKNFKPGFISSALREALGLTMPTMPPPWLALMRRFGSPPSYPNLKIPGVNAPAPAESCPWIVSKPHTLDVYGNAVYPEMYTQPAVPMAIGIPGATSTSAGGGGAKIEFWGATLPALSSDEDGDEDEALPAS